VTTLFTQSIKTIAVLADLERRGCRVISAAVIPSPSVHITPPPVGAIPSYGHLQRQPGAVDHPVECSAIIRGVRVSWMAGGVRHV
jgi:hypothetical protein